MEIIAEFIIGTIFFVFFLATILKELKFFQKLWDNFPATTYYLPSWSFFIPGHYQNNAVNWRQIYRIGGIYHMALTISASLLLISIFGFNSNIAQFCMCYITAQLILSYFIAGIKKLLSATWRDGSAMQLIFKAEVFGNKFIRLLSSWSIIIFEMLFPLVIFVDNDFIVYILIAAFVFHLMIPIFMGLNNSLLFIPSYPIALYYLKSTNFIYLAMPIIFFLIVPFLLIAWLWNKPPTTVIGWIFRISLIGIYLTDLHIEGVSKIIGLGYFSNYFFWSFFFVSIIKSLNFLLKTKKSVHKINSGKNYLSIFCHICLLIFMGLLTWEIYFTLKGAKSPGYEIELEFPLKSGSYFVVQGGSNSLVNHHYNVPGQKYALDIVKINSLGSRSKRLMPSKLSDYNIFKTNLYSPANGTILEVFNEAEDLIPPKSDPSHPAGNYIILKIENTNKALLLAHLMKNSIIVNKGDKVQSSQLLGKIGNSGNTSEPHLHIHCVEINDKKDYLYEAKSIPMIFNKTFLAKNSIYISTEKNI